MPGTLAVTIGLALLSALLGGVLAWYLGSVRCARQRARLTAEWENRLKAGEDARQRLRKQVGQIADRLEAARRGERDARGRAARTEQAMTEAAARADSAELELMDCQVTLASSNRKRDELHRQLQHLLERSRELMATSKAKDEKIFTLSRELASWQERLPPLVYRFREKDREATAAWEALDLERARSRELEDTLRTRRPPIDDPAESDPEEESDEDLKRIRGIGPVLEQLLNKMGIHRLQQIAEFGPEDVRRVQEALKDFPERIERDAWVEQARRLVSTYRPDTGESSWTGRTDT